TARAKGLQGTPFETLLGPTPHRRMKSLGNSYIETRTAPFVQIAAPSAPAELLDLAIEPDQQEQPLPRFCSGQGPTENGHIPHHRTTVAGLALKAAQKRGVPIEIVEWPGGQPGFINLDVTHKWSVSQLMTRFLRCEFLVYTVEKPGQFRSVELPVEWARI